MHGPLAVHSLASHHPSGELLTEPDVDQGGDEVTIKEAVLDMRRRVMPGFVAAVVMGILAGHPLVYAVPADGSYEGDVRPDRAVPKWHGAAPWDKDGPSMIAWAAVGDGVLAQKPGAPKTIGMYLDPIPLTKRSYTVEIRFRITRSNREGWYKGPLSFSIVRAGSVRHSIGAGFGYPEQGNNWEGGFLSGNVEFVTGEELTEVLRDDRFIGGEWVTVRGVATDNRKDRTAAIYVDGKPLLEVTSKTKSDRSSRFYVCSGDDNDAWEIDYIRWKNEALDIATPLDRPLTEEEKVQAEEEAYRRKLDALLE